MFREFVHHHPCISTLSLLPTSCLISNTRSQPTTGMTSTRRTMVPLRWSHWRPSTVITTLHLAAVTALLSLLDLTEDKQVLAGAQVDASQPPFQFVSSKAAWFEIYICAFLVHSLRRSSTIQLWRSVSEVTLGTNIPQGSRVANYSKQRIPVSHSLICISILSISNKS